MPEYYSPGVYIEEKNTLGNSVVPVPTAVPAFVGYTEKAIGKSGEALKLIPTRIASMLEYTNLFGGPNVKITVTLGPDGAFTPADVVSEQQSQNLYYALQLFFANGGGNAYIVSIGDYAASPSINDHNDAFEPLDRIDGITLLYFPDLTGLDRAERFTVHTHALQKAATRKDCFVVMDLLEKKDDFRSEIGTNNLAFGAVYSPKLNSSLPWQQNDGQIKLLKKPELTDTNLQFLDGKTLAEAIVALDAKDARAVAIMTPKWMADLRAALAALPLPILPPGGAVLGTYASTDASQGVWKAPANIALNGVAGPAEFITDAAQSDLNVPDDGSGKSINAIRQFQGRGTLVWGARTLDGNSNDWRYIQVRRTVIYIEQSIKNSLQQMVFEPNDASTWAKVRSMTEAFLGNVWREGGLAGAKPEDAFAVQCSLGQSMTTEDILNGKLVVNIALAVTRPAEFIFITLTQSISS